MTLIDHGINDSSRLSTEYWCEPEKSTDWWSKTNWFNTHKPESVVAQINHIQHQNLGTKTNTTHTPTMHSGNLRKRPFVMNDPVVAADSGPKQSQNNNPFTKYAARDSIIQSDVVEYGGIEPHASDDVFAKFLNPNHQLQSQQQSNNAASQSNVPGYATCFNRFITKPKQQQSEAQSSPSIEESDSRQQQQQQQSTSISSTRFHQTKSSTSVRHHKTKIAKQQRIRVSDLSGYSDHVKSKLNELIVVPLLHPSLYTCIGISPNQGIILSGLSGSGKTTIVKSLISKLGIYHHYISCSDLIIQIQDEQQKEKEGSGVSIESLIGSNYNSQNKKIHLVTKYFNLAKENAPSVLFFDDFECIASPIAGGGNKAQGASTSADSVQVTQIKAVLRSEMDQLTNPEFQKNSPNQSKSVIVIGATSSIDAIDSTLIRAGRFAHHINLNKPDVKQRLQILNTMTKDMKIDAYLDFEMLSQETEGYTAADLAKLCQEAGLVAIRQMLVNLACHEEEDFDNDNDMEDVDHNISNVKCTLDSVPLIVPDQFIDRLIVDQSHFETALQNITPSSGGAPKQSLKKTKWTDIGGSEQVKTQLIESISWPIKHARIFDKFNMQSNGAMLFFGPPGCGKTLMAAAIAAEMNATFISVKGPELLNSYFGESERAIRQLFTRARESSPCVIFFDELDSIAQARGQSVSSTNTDRILNQLLCEFDARNNTYTSGGSQQERCHVFIIGATNRLDSIDPALLRPGRFDDIVYIPLPDLDQRFAIMKTILKKTQLEATISNDNFRWLSQFTQQHTQGMSGADLQAIVNWAKRLAIRQHLQQLDAIHRRQEDAMNKLNGSASSRAITDKVLLSHQQQSDSIGSLLTCAHLMEAAKMVHPSVTEEQATFYDWQNAAVRNQKRQKSKKQSTPAVVANNLSQDEDDEKSETATSRLMTDDQRRNGSGKVNRQDDNSKKRELKKQIEREVQLGQSNAVDAQTLVDDLLKKFNKPSQEVTQQAAERKKRFQLKGNNFR